MAGRELDDRLPEYPMTEMSGVGMSLTWLNILKDVAQAAKSHQFGWETRNDEPELVKRNSLSRFFCAGLPKKSKNKNKTKTKSKPDLKPTPKSPKSRRPDGALKKVRSFASRWKSHKKLLEDPVLHFETDTANDINTQSQANTYEVPVQVERVASENLTKESRKSAQEKEKLYEEETQEKNDQKDLNDSIPLYFFRDSVMFGQGELPGSPSDSVGAEGESQIGPEKKISNLRFVDDSDDPTPNIVNNANLLISKNKNKKKHKSDCSNRVSFENDSYLQSEEATRDQESILNKELEAMQSSRNTSDPGPVRVRPKKWCTEATYNKKTVGDNTTESVTFKRGKPTRGSIKRCALTVEWLLTKTTVVEDVTIVCQTAELWIEYEVVKMPTTEEIVVQGRMGNSSEKPEDDGREMAEELDTDTQLIVSAVRDVCQVNASRMNNDEGLQGVTSPGLKKEMGGANDYQDTDTGLHLESKDEEDGSRTTEAVRLELNQAVASWTWDDSGLKVDDQMKDEEFVEAIRPSETKRNEEEFCDAAADVEMNIGNDRILKEFDSADEKLGIFKPSSVNTETPVTGFQRGMVDNDKDAVFPQGDDSFDRELRFSTPFSTLPSCFRDQEAFAANLDAALSRELSEGQLWEGGKEGRDGKDEESDQHYGDITPKVIETAEDASNYYTLTRGTRSDRSRPPVGLELDYTYFPSEPVKLKNTDFNSTWRKCMEEDQLDGNGKSTPKMFVPSIPYGVENDASETDDDCLSPLNMSNCDGPINPLFLHLNFQNVATGRAEHLFLNHSDSGFETESDIVSPGSRLTSPMNPETSTAAELRRDVESSRYEDWKPNQREPIRNGRLNKTRVRPISVKIVEKERASYMPEKSNSGDYSEAPYNVLDGRSRQVNKEVLELSGAGDNLIGCDGRNLDFGSGKTLLSDTDESDETENSSDHGSRGGSSRSGDAVKSGTHRGSLEHKHGNGDLRFSLQEAGNRRDQSTKQELELDDTLVDPRWLSDRDDSSRPPKNPSILLNFGRINHDRSSEMASSDKSIQDDFESIANLGSKEFRTGEAYISDINVRGANSVGWSESSDIYEEERKMIESQLSKSEVDESGLFKHLPKEEVAGGEVDQRRLAEMNAGQQMSQARTGSTEPMGMMTGKSLEFLGTYPDEEHSTNSPTNSSAAPHKRPESESRARLVEDELSEGQLKSNLTSVQSSVDHFSEETQMTNADMAPLGSLQDQLVECSSDGKFLESGPSADVSTNLPDETHLSVIEARSDPRSRHLKSKTKSRRTSTGKFPVPKPLSSSQFNCEMFHNLSERRHSGQQSLMKDSKLKSTENITSGEQAANEDSDDETFEDAVDVFANEMLHPLDKQISASLSMPVDQTTNEQACAGLKDGSSQKLTNKQVDSELVVETLQALTNKQEDTDFTGLGGGSSHTLTNTQDDSKIEGEASQSLTNETKQNSLNEQHKSVKYFLNFGLEIPIKNGKKKKFVKKNEVAEKMQRGSNLDGHESATKTISSSQTEISRTESSRSTLIPTETESSDIEEYQDTVEIPFDEQSMMKSLLGVKLPSSCEPHKERNLCETEIKEFGVSDNHGLLIDQQIPESLTETKVPREGLNEIQAGVAEMEDEKFTSDRKNETTSGERNSVKPESEAHEMLIENALVRKPAGETESFHNAIGESSNDRLSKDSELTQDRDSKEELKLAETEETVPINKPMVDIENRIAEKVVFEITADGDNLEYEPSMLEIHSKIEHMPPPEMEDHEDLRSVDDMEKVAVEHDVSVSTEDDTVLIPLRLQREEKEQTLHLASQHVGRGMGSEETGQPGSFVSKNTTDANNSFECEGRSVEEIVQSVNIAASSEGNKTSANDAQTTSLPFLVVVEENCRSRQEMQNMARAFCREGQMNMESMVDAENNCLPLVIQERIDDMSEDELNSPGSVQTASYFFTDKADIDSFDSRLQLSGRSSLIPMDDVEFRLGDVEEASWRMADSNFSAQQAEGLDQLNTNEFYDINGWASQFGLANSPLGSPTFGESNYSNPGITESMFCNSETDSSIPTFKRLLEEYYGNDPFKLVKNAADGEAGEQPSDSMVSDGSLSRGASSSVVMIPAGKVLGSEYSVTLHEYAEMISIFRYCSIRFKRNARGQAVNAAARNDCTSPLPSPWDWGTTPFANVPPDQGIIHLSEQLPYKPVAITVETENFVVVATNNMIFAQPTFFLSKKAKLEEDGKLTGRHKHVRTRPKAICSNAKRNSNSKTQVF